jgi:hypothetical protein
MRLFRCLCALAVAAGANAQGGFLSGLRAASNAGADNAGGGAAGDAAAAAIQQFLQGIEVSNGNKIWSMSGAQGSGDDDPVIAGNSLSSANALLNIAVPGNPFKSIENVKKLYSLVFGVNPDFSSATDAATFWAVAQATLLASSPQINTNCAWTATVSARDFNIAFPDENSIYHVMVFPDFGPTDLIMIDGEFPAVRYFSYQSYDSNFNPMAAMYDREIRAYNGTNPFAQAVRDPTQNGRYRLFVSKDGKRGFPNEFPAAGVDFADSAVAFVILRYYGVDPSADLTLTDLDLWGYTPPPTIAKATSGAISPTATNLGWRAYDLCPYNNTIFAQQAVTTIVEVPSRSVIPA